VSSHKGSPNWLCNGVAAQGRVKFEKAGVP